MYFAVINIQNWTDEYQNQNSVKYDIINKTTISYLSQLYSFSFHHTLLEIRSDYYWMKNINIISLMNQVKKSFTAKMSKGCLDHELAQQMSKCVEQLTTSGKTMLDETIMKKLKKICR